MLKRHTLLRFIINQSSSKKKVQWILTRSAGSQARKRGARSWMKTATCFSKTNTKNKTREIASSSRRWIFRTRQAWWTLWSTLRASIGSTIAFWMMKDTSSTSTARQIDSRSSSGQSSRPRTRPSSGRLSSREWFRSPKSWSNQRTWRSATWSTSTTRSTRSSRKARTTSWVWTTSIGRGSTGPTHRRARTSSTDSWVRSETNWSTICFRGRTLSVSDTTSTSPSSMSCRDSRWLSTTRSWCSSSSSIGRCRRTKRFCCK